MPQRQLRGEYETAQNTGGADGFRPEQRRLAASLGHGQVKLQVWNLRLKGRARRETGQRASRAKG